MGVEIIWIRAVLSLAGLAYGTGTELGNETMCLRVKISQNCAKMLSATFYEQPLYQTKSDVSWMSIGWLGIVKQMKSQPTQAYTKLVTAQPLLVFWCCKYYFLGQNILDLKFF